MSVDEIMEKKRREHRRYIMTIRFTTGLAIAVALIVAMVSVYNDMSLRARHQHEMDQLAEYYVSTGSIFQDARSMEYDIMMRRADITSNQNMVEQNVNTCYNLIDAMSAKTDDDAMIKVIEERISHVKETMSTADLLQAIEILKENFPDESLRRTVEPRNRRKTPNQRQDRRKPYDRSPQSIAEVARRYLDFFLKTRRPDWGLAACRSFYIM